MRMKKKFIEAIGLTNWNAICHELWLILWGFFFLSLQNWKFALLVY